MGGSSKLCESVHALSSQNKYDIKGPWSESNGTDGKIKGAEEKKKREVENKSWTLSRTQ